MKVLDLIMQRSSSSNNNNKKKPCNASEGQSSANWKKSSQNKCRAKRKKSGGLMKNKEINCINIIDIVYESNEMEK